MLDPSSPNFDPIIEDDDTADDNSKEWTPQRGLIKGMIACLIAAAVMTAGWIALTCVSPMSLIPHVGQDAKDSYYLAVLGVILGAGMTWVLFACMHRASGMVSQPGTIGVVMVALLMVLARQCALVALDLKVDGINASGWEWVGLQMIIISNAGVLIGIGGATYFLHEGDSSIESFSL